ncbi:MAG TPA: alpha/beta hydrolase, partial [Polyangiales bacterium]|nr:alpha/beta hydrolase [Polyangiales bacterium]
MSVARISNDRTLLAADGTTIAYGVQGSGPAIVLTNGLATTSYFWKYLAPHWAARHTVITWDMPGHGRSGPARSDATAAIEGMPAIIERVMLAAGVERAVQIGWSVGCQVVLELYRQRAARCQALVLLFGPAAHALRGTRLPLSGGILDTMLRGPGGVTFARVLLTGAQLARLPGIVGIIRRLGLVGSASDEDVRGLIREMMDIHTPSARKLACSAEDHSGLDVLKRLAVPLLIMAGDRDPFAPPAEIGERMHELAKGSEYVRLP